MAYFTPSDLATYTGNTYSAAEQTQLTTTIIPAIEAAIESYTGRRFDVGGDSDSTKNYFGVQTTRQEYSPRGRTLNADSRGRELDIDDFVEITSVTEIDSAGNETVITISDLEQLPLNKEWVDRLYHKEGSFTGYKYKVIGRLGTSDSVPQEIAYAAMQIASGALNQVGDVTKETIEGYSYEKGMNDTLFENKFVSTILGKWKKILI